jgi:hypothetical protein
MRVPAISALLLLATADGSPATVTGVDTVPPVISLDLVDDRDTANQLPDSARTGVGVRTILLNWPITTNCPNSPVQATVGLSRCSEYFLVISA